MGFLRTASRVAVASSVHGKVQRRQRASWAAQDAAAAAAAEPTAATTAPSTPPPAATAEPADMDAKLAQLAQLGDLRAAGILTDAEFDAKKAQILGS